MPSWIAQPIHVGPSPGAPLPPPPSHLAVSVEAARSGMLAKNIPTLTSLSSRRIVWVCSPARHRVPSLSPKPVALNWGALPPGDTGRAWRRFGCRCFSCGSEGKESAYSTGDPCLVPGSGGSPGECQPTPVFLPGASHG